MLRRSRPWERTVFALAIALVAGTRPAHADAGDRALGDAEQLLNTAEADIAKALKGAVPDHRKSAEERLAVGELLRRNKDYESAIGVFNQVIELFHQGKANETTHADAMFLLAESYFDSDQLPSARRQYRELVRLGDRESYSSYAGRALSRLVDVAMRRDFKDELDFVFEQLDRLRASDTSGSLQYARGKALLAAGEHVKAITELRKLPAEAPFSFQAEYLIGVVYTEDVNGPSPTPPTKDEARSVPVMAERYAKAVLQFQRLTRMKPRSPDEQHVVDLGWMALGRIFYESDDPLDAAEAYGKVGQESPEFATMLFELAWVFVSLEDHVQAQQTLELLETVAPDSLGLAEGALLRADLNLRSRQFDEALQAYTGVRARFFPAFRQLEKFLAQNKDPAVYYDRLVSQRSGVRTRGDLPPVIMDWVREIEDDRAFALIDDVSRSRKLVRDSRKLAKTMAGVLSAATRARAFPELRVVMQRALGLTNRVTFAKRELVKGLEAVSPGATAAMQLRSERAQLRAGLDALPVEVRDFVNREANASRAWDKASQKLQSLTLEADQMQAILNGLRRLLQSPDDYGVMLNASKRAQLSREVTATEADLEVYRKKIQDQREDLERGRVQVGFGDQSYEQDAKTRARFNTLVDQEFAMALKGDLGEEAQLYAQDAKALLARAGRDQAELESLERGYEHEVADKSRDLLAQVETESRSVEDGSLRLDVLDQHSRELFGEVARRSFMQVREKLSGILLRADVGIAQQAWEVRQSHLDRVQDLQRLRSSREQYLNEELQEVFHDGSEQP
jgi:tetratricopeptide (TPR) repeat protein